MKTGRSPLALALRLFLCLGSALREREGVVVPMHSTHNADILRRSVIFLQNPFYLLQFDLFPLLLHRGLQTERLGTKIQTLKSFDSGTPLSFGEHK